ncbi:MAG: hypothetical protein V4812_04680 [Pseudomonadota bacterium]
MSVHYELLNMMLEILDQDHLDTPDIQPSRPITDDLLRECSVNQVPPTIARHELSSFWGMAYNQSGDTFESLRLARAEDCDISLLTDFYQQVSSVSPSAADTAFCQGRSIRDRLEQRHASDMLVVDALTGQGDAYILVPAGEQVDYFQPIGEHALADLIWNNFVHFYSNRGIGYRDEPQNNEEKMAAAILGYDSAGSLFLGFSELDVLLQIHGGTGLFLHGASRSVIDQALGYLPTHLKFDVEPSG